MIEKAGELPCSPHPASNWLGIGHDIDKQTSVYLDLARVVAAISVFIGHSTQYHLYNGYVPLSNFSHSAVIIFFVISGIVISAHAARPEMTIQDFFLARASRIYSVAIPAILLSYGIGCVYAGLNHGIFDAEWEQYALSITTPISAALFLLQSWHYSELPWNAPYWSLCYEVWYYAIFATIFFKKGKSLILMLLLFVIISGPSIVLLFPIWWLGVEFSRRKSIFFNININYIVFIISIISIFIVNASNYDNVVRIYLHDNIPSFWRLNASQRFITDYILGILMVVNFFSFKTISYTLVFFIHWIERPIKYISGYTFSIYLYHYPLVRFCEVQFPNKENSLLHYGVCMFSIFMITIVLGSVTEKKKHIINKLISKMIKQS